jgi:SAM-dependent methyltransferase
MDFRLLPGEGVQWNATYEPLAYDSPITVRARREIRCAERRNNFRGPVPRHLTRDQISYIPQAGLGEVALDLGCGAGIHRDMLETLGYRYHGADFQGIAAQDLVDAHALPYRDGTFDFMLTIALLEHLAQPFLALMEMHRVLRPGKRLIGTAAFLEPFHDNSFFHFSPVGMLTALQASGFVLEELLVIPSWNVLRAQLEMGLERSPFPRIVPNLLSKPFMAVIEGYALIGRRIARDRSRHTRDMVHARHAGGFFYVVRKPEYKDVGREDELQHSRRKSVAQEKQDVSWTRVDADVRARGIRNIETQSLD